MCYEETEYRQYLKCNLHSTESFWKLVDLVSSIRTDVLSLWHRVIILRYNIYYTLVSLKYYMILVAILFWFAVRYTSILIWIINCFQICINSVSNQNWVIETLFWLHKSWNWHELDKNLQSFIGYFRETIISDNEDEQ